MVIAGLKRDVTPMHISDLHIDLNTNPASRLEQACKPGETYLSRAAWAPVKEAIPCWEAGTTEVKGFHDPIRTCRVPQQDAGPINILT